MDIPQPSFGNESYYHYYYNSDALASFAPCEKHLPKKISRYFLPVFYSVMCALGLLCNSFLLALFIRCKRVREAMPGSLACADLMLAGTLFFWAVYAKHDWIFGLYPCKLVTLTYAVALYGGNLSTACTVLRRHVDAACVFGCLGRVGARKADLGWCMGVWTVAALAGVPHLNFIEAREFQDQMLCTYHYGHSHGWKVYVRFQLITLSFVVPFLLALGAAWALRRSHRGHRACGTVRLTTGLMVLFFVLWFPYTVVNFLHALQEMHIISECSASLHLDLGIQITECLAFTRVVLNPIVYLYLNKRACWVLKGWWRDSREYLLESNDRTDSDSIQVELTAVQSFPNPEYDRMSAEKPKHFLPQPS